MLKGRVKYTANEIQVILIKLYDARITFLEGSQEEQEIDHQIDFLEHKLEGRQHQAKKRAA